MEERVERVEKGDGDGSNDGYLPITLVKYGVSRGKFDRQCSDGSERYFVISDILLLRHLAKYSVGAESREAATKKYGVRGTSRDVSGAHYIRRLDRWLVRRAVKSSSCLIRRISHRAFQQTISVAKYIGAAR